MQYLQNPSSLVLIHGQDLAGLLNVTISLCFLKAAVERAYNSQLESGYSTSFVMLRDHLRTATL